MTKNQQISTVRKAAQSLSGTLMGDWLDESIDIASSALDSDINPAIWVHGIEYAVKVRASAAVTEVQASFSKREAALAKQEAAFEKREANFERLQADFINTVSKTAQHLEHVMDNL